MKFRLGETFEEERERTCHWHRWFAWYPVRIGKHHHWLEYVDRRLEWHYSSYADNGWSWSTEYRAIASSSATFGKHVSAE
jgi:hypothetical protein